MAILIFDYAHAKINELTFSFPEFAPACEKSILEPRDQTDHTHF